MKRLLRVAGLCSLLLLAFSLPAEAGNRFIFSFGIGGGPVYYAPYYPEYYGSYPVPYAYYPAPVPPYYYYAPGPAFSYYYAPRGHYRYYRSYGPRYFRGRGNPHVVPRGRGRR